MEFNWGVFWAVLAALFAGACLIAILGVLWRGLAYLGLIARALWRS